MGVLRREKRLLSVSLHSVKGHSFSFLPTALVLTTLVTMRRLAHLLLLLELIVLSGTNCSKLETLHTVLLLLTCFAAFSAQLDEIIFRVAKTICALRTNSGCIFEF